MVPVCAPSTIRSSIAETVTVLGLLQLLESKISVFWVPAVPASSTAVWPSELRKVMVTAATGWLVSTAV